MPEVIVVGAGVGGMAVAARLAKLGHQVTICERNPCAGGALRAVERDGFRWDAGPTSMTLPAAVRDLFRKSGRPLERYVDLRLRSPARRHVFTDGSFVDLPTGTRTQQAAAVEQGLGAGAGRRWADFVDAQALVWEVLRREVLDQPDGGARFSERQVARALDARTSLARLLRRTFRDERLRLMAAYPFLLQGSDPREVPAYGAVEAYVERSFGVWSIAGGLAALTDALVTRLAEREVSVRYSTPVTRIDVDGDRVSGVRSARGERLAADIVVTDIDPRVVFADLLSGDAARRGRRVFSAATPATPLAVTHLGIGGQVPVLPDEVVFHGDPLVVLNTAGGSAPPEHRAWTIWHRGSSHEDPVVTLARRGVDVCKQVVRRIDRSTLDLIAETGGSAYGLAWAGWRPNARRSTLNNPLPGLYLIGAGMHPGPSIPYVVWGAASIATRVGKA